MAFNEGTKYPTAVDDDESLTPQKNNLVGAITVTYVGGATNLVLNDASQFPANGAVIFVGSQSAGNFEEGTYANRVGNTLQTVNGINNTHNAGETVELRYAAQNVNNENAAIIALQNKVGVDNSSVATSHERRIIVLEQAGSGIAAVVDDTTPQLGGDLDVNSNSIVSVSNANINITPDGTGRVVLDGLSYPSADGTANQAVITNGAGSLAFGTVLAELANDTSPQLGGQLDANGNSISMGNQQVIAPQLRDVSHTVTAAGNITGTATIDMSAANVATATVTGNVTVSFTNPPTSGEEGYLELEITNGGAFTVTWPSAVAWDGGTAPTLQTSGVDLVVFITKDAGTTWRGVRGWKQA